MLRTFLALDLDAPFLEAASSFATSLQKRPELSSARWVASSVMHVTVRFFGDTDEALIETLGLLVTRLAGSIAQQPHAALDVRATSLLAFPKDRRAHVLTLGLAIDPVLIALATEAEQAAVALGFTPEPRAFQPHLTLARLRKPADLRRLIEAHRARARAERSGASAVGAHEVRSHARVEGRTLDFTGRVSALTLYKSELGRHGPPTYSPIESASFASLPR